MRIVLFGASGFIGRHLGAALRARGDEIVEASLRYPEASASLCDGADVVVNLAGEPIASRWTKEVRESIRTSRVDLPRRLISRFAELANAPKAYISASAVGYYGTSENFSFTENSPPGGDYLGVTCSDWEAEAKKAEHYGARVGMVRSGIVLGSDGGALAKLLPIFRFGLGGPVATGRQWMSWVHIDDVVGIYLMMIDGGSGPVNATAPNPVTNADFTKDLAQALHRPAFMKIPDYALTTLYGEGAMVLTKGQRVLPEATLQMGYQFRYPELPAALAQILG